MTHPLKCNREAGQVPAETPPLTPRIVARIVAGYSPERFT